MNGFRLNLAFLGLCGLFTGLATSTLAAPLTPPQDNTQTITYWKPHIISPDEDREVRQAHEVFERLLNTWDGSRIEPSLHVVESSAGPWAASLLDGNILLSRSAIDVCNELGREHSRHLLAFVLAHELAHQRSDDLWHHKFFRLAGSQAPSVRQQILQGLSLNTKILKNLERQEAQADNDGLTIMAVVGFDPSRVVDKKDFFTQWVENIWQSRCDGTPQRAVADSCKKAKTRALRTRAQLQTIATQSVLYDLGVQAYVAGDMESARRFFRAYGRDYPSRAVYNAIGTAYLTEAIAIKSTLPARGQRPRPNYFYPLLLDTTPQAQQVERHTPLGKRGEREANVRARAKKVRKLAARAIDYFEKARRLEPNYRKTWLMQAMAYLVADNTPMAQGVARGQVVSRFGQDLAVELLMAMSSAHAQEYEEAEIQFERLLKNLDTDRNDGGVFPPDVLTYAVFHNYAALQVQQGKDRMAMDIWKKLADQAGTRGKSVLFRLALAQLTRKSEGNMNAGSPLGINNAKLGDRVDSTLVKKSLHKKSSIWFEGERWQVMRFEDGQTWVLGANGHLVSAWQAGSSGEAIDRIRMGDEADRPLKVYGIPSRAISMVSGHYLAYDQLGLAVKVVNGRVDGWFLYRPES